MGGGAWSRDTRRQATTKRAKLFGFGVLLVLIGIGSFATYHWLGPGRTDLLPVTIATSTNVWCGLPLIAQNKGYFKEEGSP